MAGRGRRTAIAYLTACDWDRESQRDRRKWEAIKGLRGLIGFRWWSGFMNLHCIF